MKYSIFIITLLFAFQLSSQCIDDCLGDDTRYGEAAGLNNTAQQVSLFGRSAGINNTGEANSVFGYSAGRDLSGTDNSIFGHRAGFSKGNVRYNSIFGSLAGQANGGSENSFFGYKSGNQTTASSNSFFGTYSGERNNTGFSNSFFGVNSGNANTIGSQNSFFGAASGATNTIGSENSFFGSASGVYNTTGSKNSFFGNNTGIANTTGEENAFFGYSSGALNTTGVANTFIGMEAGFNNVRGSHNIVIGHNAGPSIDFLDVDSTLYIDVLVTDEPLIYAQFNERLVRINGAFEAVGGFVNPSDIHLKKNIIPIEGTSILEKLSNIPMSQWSYKNEDNIRHIGPMAQDFYKAFELGKNETTINTIDADGVSIAAIQALYQLLKEEQKKNKEYASLIQSLIERQEKTEALLEILLNKK